MHKTQWQVGILFFASVILGLLVVGSTVWLKRAAQKPWVVSTLRLTQSVLSMATGWSLLYWGQWLFWSSVPESVGEAYKMSARMIVAMVFSAMVFVSVFILDYIADREYMEPAGLRALIATLGMLMGLAWEAVFTLAIDSVSGWFEHTQSKKMLVEVGLTIIMCLLVLPSWVMHILPKIHE